MNAKLAHFITLLFPRRWQRRYGEEFEALLRSGPGGFLICVNVFWSALREHLVPGQKAERRLATNRFGWVVRQPSAFAPMAMSVLALACVLAHVAASGLARASDEGAAAHLWQLLMAGQAPILIFFITRWLPRSPTQTVRVLALQALAIGASIAPVIVFHL